MKGAGARSWRAWRPTSGCVSATTNCGPSARRSPGRWRSFSARLRSSACGPRFRRRNPFSRPPGLFAGGGLRQLAAGVAIGLLAAGATLGCGELWPLQGTGRLALGRRRIHRPLHQRDLQSLAPGRLAAGDRTERARGQSGREPDARKHRSAGAAIRSRVHARLRGFAIGRDRLCRSVRGPGPALHPRRPAPTPRFAPSAGTICRSPGGRTAGAATSSSAVSRRSMPSRSRKRWKRESEIPLTRRSQIFDLGEQ